MRAYGRTYTPCMIELCSVFSKVVVNQIMSTSVITCKDRDGPTSFFA